jgi:dipeptidyl aminopeptidase/acylaminoacyl peptidase
MAIHENIALTFQNKEPVLFSRGRRSAPVFSGTTTLVTADILAFDQKMGDLFVLDRANRRIVRWSNAGTLVAQYFHTSFNEVEAFAVSSDGSELLVSYQGATTAWRIQ